MSTSRRPSEPRSASPVRLHLALQGGGAHGAFTWGALDCLLEQEDIEIGRVSGTSAGAINAAALVCGLKAGGRAEAKARLATLWRKVAETGAGFAGALLPLRKPWQGTWDDALPLLSPYQINPLGLTPLRYALDAVTDADALRSTGANAIFVNAVNVHTGAERVFGPHDMSVDAILASACAPFMFQAQQIDGEGYWDGSYAGNPAIWPLYEDELDADILMIELTPLLRAELPISAKNILNRINEIASINALASQLRALDLVNRKVEGADLRLHVLSLPDDGRPMEIEPSIKRTVSMVLFESLRQSGHEACSAWLQSNREALGRRATTDVEARYLRPYGRPLPV